MSQNHGPDSVSVPSPVPTSAAPSSLPLSGHPPGRSCPLCGWSGDRFLTSGTLHPRPDAECPRCHSLERHRIAYLVLAAQIAPGQTTLHIAPEETIAQWLRRCSSRYLSIDLMDPRAMRRMDVTKLKLRDASHTLVWCSHVLEHIPNDRKAIAEMHRVLKPGGRAIIQVPVVGQNTYEDASITTREGRRRAFGQDDHVRRYGLDVADRLSAAGFRTEVRCSDALPRDLAERCAVATYRDWVFVAHR